MSIFKYLTLSHLQKVLAALEVRFKGIENNISEIKEDVNKVEIELGKIDIKQSDWGENDSADNSYILNKPAIKSGDGENSVLIGDLEQVSNATIYDITITGDANTTTYTYTTEAAIATPNKSNYILFYSDKFYPLRDMTDSVLTLFSSIGNTAISNADAKLYYKYKTASGVDSIAEGQGTVASGQRSHAEGAGSKATGSYSHAEGMNAISNGTASHSEGFFTKSLSSATHTEGYGTEALVLYSHAEGNLSVANGQGSHSEGYKTETNGNYAHSEGKYTNANGLSSHSEGYASTATGYGSHSEGSYAVYNATLTGEANTLTYTVTNSTLKLRSADRAKSLIIYVGSSEWAVESATLDSNGYLTSVTLEKTIGGSTSYTADIRISPCANGHGSHTEGMATFTSANASHAEGLGTEALGEASHAEGLQTIAGSSHQHVQGKYNIEDSSNTYADIVGNGTDSNTRSNAYTLDWSGNGIYAGKLTVGTAPTNNMDVATKKYVDDTVSGSSGSSTLVDLTDTTILSASNGQVLTYNSTTSKWENNDIPSDVFIVNITSTTENNVTTYSADKTYNEILTAYNNNKRCVCIMSSGIILTLSQVNSYSEFVRFSSVLNIGETSAKGKTAGLRYVLIRSTGVVEYNSMSAASYETISENFIKYDNFGLLRNDASGGNFNVATNNYSKDELFLYGPQENRVLSKALVDITSGTNMGENTHFVTTTLQGELELRANVSDVLTKTNTTSYTPTANYHPATKKYVDDSISGFSTDLSGLSDTTITTPADGQLLKYNATSGKWENVTLSLAINNNVIQLKEGNTVISSVTLPVYNGGVSS